MRTIQKSIIVVTVISLLLLPTTLNASAIATTQIGNFQATYRFYVIQNVHSGKFLEVANGNLVQGTNVWQDTFNFDSNLSQMFALHPADADDLPKDSNGDLLPLDETYYQVVSAMNTDLCLDVHNADNVSGANIKVFSENFGLGAQSFAFILNENDGSFRIKPVLARNSNLVLSVVNNSTANQANVELAAWDSNNPSQRWVMKEINPVKDGQLIDLNWSYFFRGQAGTDYRRITQRVHWEGTNRSKWHIGTDIYAPTGTAIYSPCAGTVYASGKDTTMGYYVIIKTNATIGDASTGGAKRLTLRLMHMDQLPKVSAGQAVTANNVLGYVGNTGKIDGEHLHIDINTEEYTSGDDIRADLASVINTEKLFLSKRFRYGSANKRVYATEVVF